MWVGLANIVKLPITINHLPARAHSEQDSAVIDVEILFTELPKAGDMVPVEKNVPGLPEQAAQSRWRILFSPPEYSFQ